MHSQNELFVRGKDKDTGRWIEGYYYHYEDTVFCFKEDYDRIAGTDRDPRHDAILFDKQGDWGLPNEHKKAEPIDMSTLSLKSPFHVNSKRNGREERVCLYEGDIIETSDHDMKYRGIVRFGEYGSPTDSESYHYGWYIEWLWNRMMRKELGYWIKKGKIFLIGNIWDNSEMVQKSVR